MPSPEAPPVVIITGGATGIGRAVADAFAARGARLVLVGRRQHLLRRAETELRDRAEVAVVCDDLLQPSAASRVAATALDRFSRVDTLINNAGAPGEGCVLHEVDDDLWAEIVDTNLGAAFRMLRAILPILASQGGGAIVNVASTAALVGLSRMAAYCAAKAGLVALTRAVALDYGARGVRCNCVCPGLTATPMTANVLDDARRREAALRAIPAGRAADPSEIAHAVAWLCGDATSSVNGAVLAVDGGQTLPLLDADG